MARVLHKGVLKEVVIDDYFPCSRKDNQVMGAKPAGGVEIWVMILEKCWAKLYGSYDNIDGTFLFLLRWIAQRSSACLFGSAYLSVSHQR